MSDNSLDVVPNGERMTLLSDNERDKLEKLPGSNEEKRWKTLVSEGEPRPSHANLNKSDTVSVSDAGSR